MGVTEPLPYAVGPSIGHLVADRERGAVFPPDPPRQRRLRRRTEGTGNARPIRAYVKPDNTLRQLRELRRFVPAFAQVQLIRVWSGIEGYTGDAVPVLGPSATTVGLHYAFGFNGEGFAIGPGVGEVMAELIATGATTTPIEPFSIARFAQKVALPA